MKMLSAVLLLSGSLSGIVPFSPAIHSAQAQASPEKPAAVLVELFTSEGCSSCPPADALLREVNGRNSAKGQLIVGISEHVTYWNNLGWKDPYSADFYTSRQSHYSDHFGLDSVYTPQIIVNGREQFVGGDRHALDAALAKEAAQKHILLHITSAEISGNKLNVQYTAEELPGNDRLELFAVIVDDVDSSHVLRGENSGRELSHVSVARAFASLGPLQKTEQGHAALPLPATIASANAKHHLVLFAQQSDAGVVVGVDTAAL